jgi:hypothetical protein
VTPSLSEVVPFTDGDARPHYTSAATTIDYTNIYYSFLCSCPLLSQPLNARSFAPAGAGEGLTYVPML